MMVRHAKLSCVYLGCSHTEAIKRTYRDAGKHLLHLHCEYNGKAQTELSQAAAPQSVVLATAEEGAHAQVLLSVQD